NTGFVPLRGLGKIGSPRKKCLARPREFLREVRRHPFWQVETRQFPLPIDQSEPNTETLVERPVNRNGYIKVSAAVIRVKPGLPCAAQTVRRKGSRKTRRPRWIGRYRSLAKQIKQSLRIEYYFGQQRICDHGPKQRFKTSAAVSRFR